MSTDFAVGAGRVTTESVICVFARSSDGPCLESLQGEFFEKILPRFLL